MPGKLFAVVACLIGLAGAGVFLVYVVGTGVGMWPRDEVEDYCQPIAINASLLMLFAVQHSGMARQAFKKRFGTLFRSTYVATSGLVLGALTLLWQLLPGAPLWETRNLGDVAPGLVFALGVCWFSRHDLPSFFGLTQAWTGMAEIRGKLYSDGPYRYVRHPLMLALLLILWTVPIMPPELLMLNIGMTIYILIAIRWEERDLVREFGVEYENYRRKVSALIPFVW